MKKIIVSIIVIGLLLTTSIVSVNAFNIEEETMESEISRHYSHAIPYANIYVDDDNTQGPWDGTYQHPYQSIQDGVDAAEDGDTVFVFTGTYYEHVTVNKMLDLVGEDREGTIIDGSGSGTVVYIYASSVVLCGFMVVNGSQGIWDHGITMSNEADVHIFDCVVTGNGGGIRFNSGFDSSITDCYLHNNSSHDISVYLDSENILIKNCTMANSGEALSGGGLRIVGIGQENTRCSNITVTGCDIFGSITVGISISLSDNVEICYNNIHDNSWIGVAAGSTEGPCSDIEIHNNTINENGIDHEQIGFMLGGIWLQGCSDCVTVKHNIIKSNIYNGIVLLRSFRNEIFENNILENRKGIYLLYNNSNNKFIGNNISNNGYGIYADNLSLNNHFYYNNFLENEQHAHDELGINLWYNPISMMGNYWDDYNGVDVLPPYGVGDIPYNIPPYPFPNKDRFPLMNIFNGSQSNPSPSQQSNQNNQQSNNPSSQPSSQQSLNNQNTQTSQLLQQVVKTNR